MPRFGYQDVVFYPDANVFARNVDARFAHDNHAGLHVLTVIAGIMGVEP